MASTRARMTSAVLVRRLYEEELYRQSTYPGTSPAQRVAERTGLSKARVLELLGTDIEDSPYQAHVGGHHS